MMYFSWTKFSGKATMVWLIAVSELELPEPPRTIGLGQLEIPEEQVLELSRLSCMYGPATEK